MPNFKEMPMDPRQLMMFPSSVNESIPADAEVRILSEAMENLDWRELQSSYSSRSIGTPYPPKVLTRILVYGLSRGIRSSRALEDMVRNHKHYIFLSGGLTPDHSTISRFRKENEVWLRSAFRGTVRICAEAGHVLLKVAATDGSKIQARASKKSLYGQKRLDREMAAIDQILAEAEETDRREDEMYGSASGNAVPRELADAKKRKEKLEEIATRLKESGRKSVSATEEECRVMKTTNGLRPAYNSQITVDSAEGVILAADVINAETDHGQLEGQLKQVEENTGLKVDVSLSDTGYCDEETLKFLAESGRVSVVADAKKAMKKKLKTPEGKELYALRRQNVERVFANIKSNKGLNRFSLSGMTGAKSEFWLACMTHNLMILVRKAAAARLLASFAANIVGWTACWIAVRLMGPYRKPVRPGPCLSVA